MKQTTAAIALAVGVGLMATGAHATVTFSTFVSSANIFAVEGQNNVIAFTFADTMFVGSVWRGANNNQLYSTNLSGTNVQKFGQPIPGVGEEVVVAAGLGQAGFPRGTIYIGNGQGNQLGIVPAVGPSTRFGDTGNPGENIRQILFDPGMSFGGRMLVSTSSGRIYSFDSTGTPTLLASIGEDTEGMDIASSAYGQYAGYLLVVSEGPGRVRAISPAGVVTVLQSSTGGNVFVPLAETISTVPIDLGTSGSPLEGFYVANFQDVGGNDQFAAAAQFAGLRGDAIVTSEQFSNSQVWDLHYNGDLLNTFTLTQIGNLPNQSEDGIFVTAHRLGVVPEPPSLVLLGTAMGALGLLSRRRKRSS